MKPDVSIPVALGTAAMVYGVYQVALPSVAEARTADADDTDLEKAETYATWGSTALVAAVSLIAKDPVPLWIGGAMIVILAWGHRHARLVNPETGKIDLGSARRLNIISEHVA